MLSLSKTQANLIIISSILRPHEAIVAASTGHISVHETGAIEATGHKICTIETEDGKLTVEHIKEVLEVHESEHMVKPKMVFISNTTELGTIYKKEELQEISKFCKENNLYLTWPSGKESACQCRRRRTCEIDPWVEKIPWRKK